MSGNYGPGGYPAHGHDAPDYDADPRRRRPGGPPPSPGISGWVWSEGASQGGDQRHQEYPEVYPPRPGYPPEYDQGYQAEGYPAEGYDGQDYGRAGHGYENPAYQGQPSYDGPGYDDQAYDGGQGYGGQGYGDYRDRGYDQQHGNGYPPGTGEYRYQGTGPEPGQYGTVAQPANRSPGGPPEYGQPQYDQPRYDQYDQQGTGPRRPPAGHDNWDQAESDDSFLPGFRGTNGRPADRDTRRAPRGGRRNGRGPAVGDQSGNEQQSGRDQYGYDRQSGYDQRADYDQQASFGEQESYRDGDRDHDGDRPGRGGPGAGPRGPRPGDRDDWGSQPPRPRKKVTRWFPRILVLSIVAVILIGGTVGGLSIYHKYEARYHPTDFTGAGSGDVVFQVKSGDTAFSIAPRLFQMGIVASQRAFTNAAESAPTTTSAGTTSGGLEAGYYNLHLHMQASLAYAALTNPKNAIQTAVTIPEGKRVSQVLSILAANTKIPLSQFEAAAKETSKLGLPSYAGTTVTLASTVPYGQLEGYLFPATYTITPHETALQVLQAMVARFNVEATQVNITQAAQAAGLSAKTLMIEASMVQAEAGVNSDMPKMASVINNRQKAGMPDGFDSVVFYGLGRYGINIPNGLNPATAGLYDNTQKTGLPPTPIDNPGDAAIQAVLHPATTNYLYFLTTATGKATEFSNNCHDLPGTC